MTTGKPHPLRALLVTQFLGAFNDNAWKMIVVFLAIGAAQTDLTGDAAQAAAQTQTALAFVAFMLPLVLVSLPAGAIADRVSKRSVIIAMKVFEALIMAAACVVLWFQPEGGTAALFVLGLMGLQSGLFSPAKYGILPEILPHDRLSAGNGQLEMWTFMAIVLGTAGGGLLLTGADAAPWVAASVLLVLAIVGSVTSFGVPKVGRARDSGGLIDTVVGGWRAVRDDRPIWLSVLGLGLFWGVASLLGQNVLVYAKLVLDLSDTTAGLPMAAIGVGVGVGSVLAGKLSGGKVELGLVPLGAIMMSVFVLVLALAQPGLVGTLFVMGALGVSSGFLLVPLNALIQWRAPSDRVGSIIAMSNVLHGIGMLVGSFGMGFLAQAGMDVNDITLATGVIALLGTFWALWLLPSAGLRMGLVIATHTIYRLKVVDRDKLPAKGGVLLTPNHVSFADGLFVIASTDRPVRFLIDAEYFERPLLKPFVRALGTIPVSPRLGQDEILRALSAAGEALDRGEVVCVFPEGQITRTGGLLQFRRGMERIARHRKGVIVPINLDRVWGSVFSREGGRFLWKWPKKIPYPVTVVFGDPLPTDTSANVARKAVHALSTRAWEFRKADGRPLHRSAIRMFRRRRWRLAFADAAKPNVTRFKALVGVIALGRALRDSWDGRERIGVLMPPTVAGALVNIAAAAAGRTTVNLNYTAGRAGMEAAARIAGVDRVITAKAFLHKANLELPDGLEPIWLGEIAKGISDGDRFRAVLLALFATARGIERSLGRTQPASMDEVATIVFSSGSTGDPKGVPLTHFNLASNVDAVAQVFRPEKDDRMLGILPFFHAFGYMKLWFAAVHGMPSAFQANPLDAIAVGRTVQRYDVTLLLATPTLLSLYTRGCKPTHFGSLRVVVAGAEKMTDAVGQAFEDRFGIRPLEGYGATECAPVIAVGTPDFRARGFYQPGSRRGTVGTPVPGVSVEIVDPDTYAPLPLNTPGMIIVRGPNVMAGYLDRPDLTAAAMHEGWYVTGDIGTLDDDGFLRITDRLARFSKIGGEMVPHGRIEHELALAAHTLRLPEESQLAVTAIVDERKGERLVVVHTVPDLDVDRLRAELRERGLPNLWIPKASDFVRIDELPVLGTGKLDLRGVRAAAEAGLGA